MQIVSVARKPLKIIPSPEQVGRFGHNLLRLVPLGGSSASFLLDRTKISRIPPTEAELKLRENLLLAHTNAYLQSNQNPVLRGDMMRGKSLNAPWLEETIRKRIEASEAPKIVVPVKGSEEPFRRRETETADFNRITKFVEERERGVQNMITLNREHTRRVEESAAKRANLLPKATRRKMGRFT